MTQVLRWAVIEFRAHSKQRGSDLPGDVMAAITMVAVLYLGIAGVWLR